MNIIVVLDNIRSMNNIGSIFRTCDAIGNTSIYLCGICATPPNKQIHKTALGATESVNWTYFASTKKALLQLKNENYQIVAIEQNNHSISLENFKPKQKKIAIIFGNEIKGINDEELKIANQIVEIQQHGSKKSMNVSVVAGIVLWTIKNTK